MVIDVHCIAYNEEKIIPHFVRHYAKFCRHIYIWDNESTDNTVNVALEESNKVKIRKWRSDGIDERIYIQLKQGCRHYSHDADFVIVVDADEFLDIPLEYLEKCKEEGVTLPKVSGFEMLATDYDFESDINTYPFHSLLKENLGKRCIFNPKLDMKWDVGCHPSPVGQELLKQVEGIVEDPIPVVFLNHYKWVNLDYIKERYKSYASRLSEFNKNYRLGFHYTKTEEEIEQEYKDMLEQC